MCVCVCVCFCWFLLPVTFSHGKGSAGSSPRSGGKLLLLVALLVIVACIATLAVLPYEQDNQPREELNGEAAMEV